MGKVISTKEAENILYDHLLGCSINLVTYFITGWTLRLIGKEGPELNIQASDIAVPRIEEWRTAFTNLPADLLKTNEPDDVITAAIVFSALNKWPIRDISIDDQSNMILSFENKTEIIIKAHVDYVDWTWQVDREDGSNIVHCDSGTLTLNDIM